MSELVISSVQGWAPGTRLYRNVTEVGDAWLISVITVSGVRDATVDVVATANGVDPHGASGTGHAEIYRADVTETPVYDWIQTSPDIDYPQGDYDITYPDDDHLVATLDGVEYRAERQLIRTDYSITAIDADGDPLNGLTPWAVLPHGTTFEQALDHIAQEA